MGAWNVDLWLDQFDNLESFYAYSLVNESETYKIYLLILLSLIVFPVPINLRIPMTCLIVSCCRASKLYDASFMITFTTVHGLGMNVAFAIFDCYITFCWSKWMGLKIAIFDWYITFCFAMFNFYVWINLNIEDFL